MWLRQDKQEFNTFFFNILIGERRRQASHIKIDPTQTCCENVHRVWLAQDGIQGFALV
jgi:hypothetical protein